MAETEKKKTTDKRPKKDAAPPGVNVDELLAGNVGAHDDFTPEDLRRGYRVAEWKIGIPTYIALDESSSQLDEAAIQAHVKRRGLDTILARARKRFGKQ